MADRGPGAWARTECCLTINPSAVQPSQNIRINRKRESPRLFKGCSWRVTGHPEITVSNFRLGDDTPGTPSWFGDSLVLHVRRFDGLLYLIAGRSAPCKSNKAQDTERPSVFRRRVKLVMTVNQTMGEPPVLQWIGSWILEKGKIQCLLRNNPRSVLLSLGHVVGRSVLIT